jgi:hypothetical protein
MENETFKCGDVVYYKGKIYEIVEETYLVWYLEIMPVVYSLATAKGTVETMSLPHQLKLAPEKDTKIWRLLYGSVYDKYFNGKNNKG